MKNYDVWKKFVRTGSINDYLDYIACTKDMCSNETSALYLGICEDKEGDIHAGIDYGNGNGSVGHTSW
ncbi:MAG TPA: hypothetical protein GXZ21_09755 [Clostridiales bacterium]|nr:hypothetical protein [Clostridiales bacterium]